AVTVSGAVAIWKSADSVTVNGALLIAVAVGVVTVIGPVVAPWGTVVAMDVVVAEAMTDAVPLKRTRLFVGTASKFCPVIVTVVPTGPCAGVNPVMLGPITVSVLLADRR